MCIVVPRDVRVISRVPLRAKTRVQDSGREIGVFQARSTPGLVCNAVCGQLTEKTRAL
jgi:hypothetical protein